MTFSLSKINDYVRLDCNNTHGFWFYLTHNDKNIDFTILNLL